MPSGRVVTSARWVGGLTLSLVATLCAMGGCDDGRIPSSCGALPDQGGCPNDSIDSCKDPSCTGIYACRASGHWELVRSCPARTDAGTDGGVLDADSGLPGCGETPDATTGSTGAVCAALQAPDCDVSVALSCPGQACTTGCETFLRCTEGVWEDVYAAYCDEDGVLVWNTP